MNRPFSVTLLLPPNVARDMFRETDLNRLKEIATIDGPVQRSSPELAEALAKTDVILGGWGSPPFDPELLSLAPKLKLFAYSAGSVKGIVTDALYDRGIKVITAAAGNAVPVAQFTVASMVMLLKQIPWLATAMGRHDLEDQARRIPAGRELMHMTVGLVGASRIGRLVVGLLKSYAGLTIRMYDPYLTEAQAAEMGVIKSSLDDVCRCEVVSLHAPNIPETKHTMNARTLRLLPDHAVFINTSRGALVDEAALVAEVRRRPLYVLLDVTDPEPPEANSPLRSEPNILLTPHIAGAMRQARLDMGKLAIEETISFLTGQPLKHEVTREMLATQA